jgi:putative membrane protein
MKFSKIVLSLILALCFTAFSTGSFAKEKDHDGEIIAYMEAINNTEISAAKIAKDKKVDANVMSFADLMIEQHGQNLQQITDLSNKINIAPDETTDFIKFKESANKDLENLSKLSGEKFQKSYIHAMVTGHKDADKMLTKFEKEAKNKDLQQYLVETKKAVEQHLAAAKKLK